MPFLFYTDVSPETNVSAPNVDSLVPKPQDNTMMAFMAKMVERMEGIEKRNELLQIALAQSPTHTTEAHTEPVYKSNVAFDRRASTFTGANIVGGSSAPRSMPPKCLTDGRNLTAKFNNSPSESIKHFLIEFEQQA